MDTLREAIESGNARRINETIASASLSELKQAYRELLSSGNQPATVKLLETALSQRQKLIGE